MMEHRFMREFPKQTERIDRNLWARLLEHIRIVIDPLIALILK